MTKELYTQVENVVTWINEIKKKVSAIEANESADKVKLL